MVKKSCDKHIRYVYNCDNCRKVNGEGFKGSEESKKEEETEILIDGVEESYDQEKPRRYLDAYLEEARDSTPESEDQDDVPPSKPYSKFTGQPRPNPRGRYVYKKQPTNKKKVQLFGILIFVIIILLVVWLYAIPSWHAGISLREQMYNLKANNLPFIDFYILNWWSTNFIINKVGLIGALIGCTIMSLPPERNLIAMIGTKLGWGKPSYKKALTLWWTVGFALFYFIGQSIDGISYFSFTMYMIENNTLEFSIGSIFTVHSDVFSGRPLSMVDIFLYNNVFLPLAVFVIGLIIFRIIINISANTYLRRNDYLVLSYGSFLISMFFALHYISIPLNSYDGLGLTLLWISPLGLFGFLGLGIFFRVLYATNSKSGKSINSTFLSHDRKKSTIAVGVLLTMMLLPAIFSVPTAISINQNYSSWLENRWEVQTQNQIAWTRSAAGLDMFENRPINNLTASKTVSDLETVQSIRQYDKKAALSSMYSYVPSPFESLGDSDIIYVETQSGAEAEFWVAPKTLKISHISSSNIWMHTNVFDHVEGYLAIDTFTGDILDSTDAFNELGVQNDYPIFFGEHESKDVESSNVYGAYDDYFTFADSYGAFDDDILLNTGWEDEDNNFAYEYEGTPDGTLEGREAFWFTNNMGLFSYAINSSFEKEFIISRNIETRVSDALLPGLWIDSDPYLVFDRDNEKMYYAVSICTNLPLKSYAKSNIYRFLGVCLVDTKTGELSFHKNPVLEDQTTLNNDPTYPIWKIYLEKYDWETITDDWLLTQFRYPEDLYEEQLRWEYYYHVQDADTWFSESQFHERPPNGDVFYVEMDLGEGIEFVGVDIVQRTTSSSTGTSTLAGIYVLRHGLHIGEVIFYEAPTAGNKMVGPDKAQEGYITEASTELALILSKQYGNTLLYPLNNSLYYFIPTYATSGDLMTLQHVGFVNAFDIQDVGYGSDAFAAYEDFGFVEEQTTVETNVTLDWDAPNTITLPENGTFRFLTEVIDLNYTHSPYDVVVNVSIQSDACNITVFGNPVPTSAFEWGSGSYPGLNFTVIDELLEPGEIYGVNALLSADIGSYLRVTVQYRVEMYVDGELVYDSGLKILTIYKGS